MRQTLEQISRKHIYLDEATLKNLRGLKSERLRRKLTQKALAGYLAISHESLRYFEYGNFFPCLAVYMRMSEYFGWEMERNPNCLYYRLVRVNKLGKWLKKCVRRYGYTAYELAQRLNVDISSVKNTLYQRKVNSLHFFGLIYELFTEEARQEQIRSELLKSKRRGAYEQGIKRVKSRFSVYA